MTIVLLPDSFLIVGCVYAPSQPVRKRTLPNYQNFFAEILA